jgi:hypothetical protein
MSARGRIDESGHSQRHSSGNIMVAGLRHLGLSCLRASALAASGTGTLRARGYGSRSRRRTAYRAPGPVLSRCRSCSPSPFGLLQAVLGHRG